MHEGGVDHHDITLSKVFMRNTEHKYLLSLIMALAKSNVPQKKRKGQKVRGIYIGEISRLLSNRWELKNQNRIFSYVATLYCD